MSNLSTSTRKIQPQDYDVFLGLDVDKQKIVLTQLDQMGIEKVLSMPYDSKILLGYVRNHLGGKRVA
jgi:hypothetical protein